MTAMTLVAALASFIFLPLSQALIDAHGWRDALLVLAGSSPPSRSRCTRWCCGRRRAAPPRQRAPVGRRDACARARSGSSSAAFVLASLSTFAMTVSRSRSSSSAATRRLRRLRGRTHRRRTDPRPAAVRDRPAAAARRVRADRGIVVIVTVHGAAAVLAGMVVLGMGSGMAILARATVVADRYGSQEYGAIGGVLAAVTTGARGRPRRRGRLGVARGLRGAAVDAGGARRAGGGDRGQTVTLTRSSTARCASSVPGSRAARLSAAG